MLRPTPAAMLRSSSPSCPRLRTLGVGSLAAAMLALAGCALLPKTTDTAAPAAPVVLRPDPTAPRLAPLDSKHYELESPDQELVGAPQVLFTRYEDTFSAIAQHYNVGYEELRHANPGVDHWLPGEATPVYLPTELILPDAPRRGIVINVPAMRLYYYDVVGPQAGRGATRDDSADPKPERRLVATYAIGIGEEGWATPLGEGTVTQKARDPVWYVPASIRKAHAARGEMLPSVVQPGPDNPLGRHALALSLPGYLIHGTNKPAGVGMRSSHGCIRLYPGDIAELFEVVTKGTAVNIVNQPVLAGWRNGELYLEVHRPLAEDQRDVRADVDKVLADALERAGVAAAELDQAVIDKVLTEQRGMPFPVLRSRRTPDQHLARARIIENSTPQPARTLQAAEPAAP